VELYTTLSWAFRMVMLKSTAFRQTTQYTSLIASPFGVNTFGACTQRLSVANWSGEASRTLSPPPPSFSFLHAEKSAARMQSAAR